MLVLLDVDEVVALQVRPVAIVDLAPVNHLVIQHLVVNCRFADRGSASLLWPAVMAASLVPAAGCRVVIAVVASWVPTGLLLRCRGLLASASVAPTVERMVHTLTVLIAELLVALVALLMEFVVALPVKAVRLAVCCVLLLVMVKSIIIAVAVAVVAMVAVVIATSDIVAGAV